MHQLFALILFTPGILGVEFHVLFLSPSGFFLQDLQFHKNMQLGLWDLIWHPIHTVFLPLTQCSCYRLQIHLNPRQVKGLYSYLYQTIFIAHCIVLCYFVNICNTEGNLRQCTRFGNV